MIAITREAKTFPENETVSWLYDCSGGRGKVPNTWPRTDQDRLVGYAGGIGPENVLDVLDQIPSTNYWIDMETHVRTNDIFDLDKCLSVLKQVYPS